MESEGLDLKTEGDVEGEAREEGMSSEKYEFIVLSSTLYIFSTKHYVVIR